MRLNGLPLNVLQRIVQVRVEITFESLTPSQRVVSCYHVLDEVSRKILYPVIGIPPVLDGWLHVTMMLFSEASTAVVGALGYPGMVAAVIENGSE